MNPYVSVVPKTPGKFRVGDMVRIPHGWGGARGVVVEDRGFGYRGWRYYGVKVQIEDEPELPFAEHHLEPAVG